MVNSSQLVELKNGETYNGHMIACDNFMNITLRDVILTAPDGDKFYQMKEVYLKGNVVSALRLYLAGRCVNREVGMGIPMERENGLECWSVLGMLRVDVGNRRSQSNPRWRLSRCHAATPQNGEDWAGIACPSLRQCDDRSGEKQRQDSACDGDDAIRRSDAVCVVSFRGSSRNGRIVPRARFRVSIGSCCRISPFRGTA